MVNQKPKNVPKDSVGVPWLFLEGGFFPTPALVGNLSLQSILGVFMQAEVALVEWLEVRRNDSDWSLDMGVRAELALGLVADLDSGRCANPAATVKELRAVLDDLKPKVEHDAFQAIAARLQATLGD